MDKWQREFISKHLDVLVSNTKCSTYMLSFFRSKKHLSKEEYDKLDAIKMTGGDIPQAQQFYDILVTRVDSYELLVTALLKTDQTEVGNLLSTGYLMNGLQIPINQQRQVIIQGKKVNVSKLEEMIGSDTFRNLMPEAYAVDPEIAKQFSNDTFVLIPDNIPIIEHNLIRRTLKTFRYLNRELLPVKNNDIFVIENIKRAELTEMVAPNLTSDSENHLDELEGIQYIVLTCHGNFEVICKNSGTKNVHWLRYENNEFTWIRTHGDPSNLFDYITQTPKEYSLEELVKNSKSNKPDNVCITGVPGMGKTTLSQTLSHEIKKNGDGYLVFYHNFSDLIEVLSFYAKKIDKNIATKIISMSVGNAISELGQKILENLLDNPNQRIYIFLDTLDELPEILLKPALEFVNILKDFQETFVYVSTRPHLCKHVQSILSCFVYQISPLNEKQQVDLLEHFWKIDHSKSSDPNLLNWTQKCITTIKKNLLEDENCNLGIPLQCKIVGEIYERQAQHQQQTNFRSQKTTTKISSKYDIYNELLSLRFERTKKHPNQETNWPSIVKNVHFLAAADTLFPDHSQLFVKMMGLDVEKYLDNLEILSLDIIKPAKNGKFQFEHKTFAEFLFAELIVNMLIRSIGGLDPNFLKAFLNFLDKTVFVSKPETVTLILHELAQIESKARLSHFFNEDLLYFLDFHLKQHSISTKVFPFCPPLHELDCYDMTTACTVSNFRYIFEFLTLFSTNMNTLPVYKMLQGAAKLSGRDLINFLCSKIQKNIWDFATQVENWPTPLQIAAQRGDYDVIEVFKKFQPPHQFMLHFCLRGSMLDNHFIIEEKLEILNLLCSNATGGASSNFSLHAYNTNLSQQEASFIWRTNIDETLHDGTTAILQPYSHVKLVERLLEKGANVNCLSHSHDSILHVFLKNVSQEAKDTVVQMLDLLINYKFSHFNSKNHANETPLEIAMRSITITKEIINKFLVGGTNFFHENPKTKENAMFWAVKSSQNEECLSSLLSLHTSVLGVNLKYQNLLHLIASRRNLIALRMLETIDETKGFFKISVNQRDKYGNTPMHILCQQPHENLQEMLDIFMKHGADQFIANSNGNTPIEHGLFSYNLQIFSPHLLEKLNIGAPIAENISRFLLKDFSITKKASDEELSELFSFFFEKTRENFLLSDDSEQIILRVNDQDKHLHHILGEKEMVNFQKRLRSLSYLSLRSLYTQDMPKVCLVDVKLPMSTECCGPKFYNCYTYFLGFQTQPNDTNNFRELIANHQIIDMRSLSFRLVLKVAKKPIFIFNLALVAKFLLDIRTGKTRVSCIIANQADIPSITTCVVSNIVEKYPSDIVCYVIFNEIFNSDLMNPDVTKTDLIEMVFNYLARNPVSKAVLQTMFESQKPISLICVGIEENSFAFHLLCFHRFIKHVLSLNSNISVCIISSKRQLLEELTFEKMNVYEAMTEREQIYDFSVCQDEREMQYIKSSILDLLFLATLLILPFLVCLNTAGYQIQLNAFFLTNIIIIATSYTIDYLRYESKYAVNIFVTLTEYVYSFKVFLYHRVTNLKATTASPTQVAQPNISKPSDVNPNTSTYANLSATTLLILGESGVGKSTWINSLVNYLTYGSLSDAEVGGVRSPIPSRFTIFDEQHQSMNVCSGYSDNEMFRPGQTATQHSKMYTLQVGSEIVRLIDTPGFENTGTIEQDNKKFQDILRITANIHDIHGICVLLTPNNTRVNKAFRYCILKLLHNLHPDASKNIIFCFTKTRATSFKPETTMLALEKLLHENNYGEILLERKTVYCFDSEAYRYLAARINNPPVTFSDTEKSIYELSWKNSTAETTRMFAYIKSIKPHQTTITINLNHARELVLDILRPLAEITRFICRAIAALEQELQILHAEIDLEDQQKSRFTTWTDIRATHLDFPKTVCSNINCTRTLNQDPVRTLEYATICHHHCMLDGVSRDVIGHPSLKNCVALSESGGTNCRNCKHPYTDHLHMFYDTMQVIKEIENPSVSDGNHEASDFAQTKQIMINKREARIMTFEEDYAEIEKTSAEFGYFLKVNAVTHYEDIMEKYLKFFIKEESDKVTEHENPDVLRNLKCRLGQYVHKRDSVEESRRRTSVLNPTDIECLVNKLKELQFFGAYLAEALNCIHKTRANVFEKLQTEKIIINRYDNSSF